MACQRLCNDWVVTAGAASQARLRLICFPFAGGGASAFFGWSSLLPPEIELCAVQLPGREHRRHEPLIVEMDRLVAAAADELALLLAGRPFAFYGHSLGAIVAFELARTLRRRGLPAPRALVVGACPAPQLSRAGRQRLHTLADDALIDRLRRFEGTPEAILQSAELMALFLPVLRADFALFETYTCRPEPPLDCRIEALAGSDDREAPRGEMEPWRDQTACGFNLATIPGGHFFHRSSQATVVDWLVRCLCTPGGGP